MYARTTMCAQQHVHICVSWGLTNVKCGVEQRQTEKTKKEEEEEEEEDAAHPYRLCCTLSIMSFFVCNGGCRRASALLCILTALCKWLAGGNDFREKVILRPLVHINDSFIHSQVYMSR